MVKPLPKWVMQKYSELWVHFGEKQFEHPEAADIIQENTSVLISHMRKNGWLTIQLHPEDSRKRVYKLKSPEQAITEMGTSEVSEK